MLRHALAHLLHALANRVDPIPQAAHTQALEELSKVLSAQIGAQVRTSYKPGNGVITAY